jgi:hypothetical protein
MSSGEYCPPGLGRRLEDLINKHSDKGAKESTYQWALRNAARTRELLERQAAKAVKLPEPAQPKPETPKPAKEPKRQSNSRGRAAYEWGIAHGKTCQEAADHCGVRPSAIQSYRGHHGLPPLKDGRTNHKDYRRERRPNEMVDALCAKAYADMKRTGDSVHSVAFRHRISPQSLARFAKKNGGRRG